jgi:hypothetical protein
MQSRHRCRPPRPPRMQRMYRRPPHRWTRRPSLKRRPCWSIRSLPLRALSAQRPRLLVRRPFGACPVLSHTDAHDPAAAVAEELPVVAPASVVAPAASLAPPPAAAAPAAVDVTRTCQGRAAHLGARAHIRTHTHTRTHAGQRHRRRGSARTRQWRTQSPPPRPPPPYQRPQGWPRTTPRHATAPSGGAVWPRSSSTIS